MRSFPFDGSKTAAGLRFTGFHSPPQAMVPQKTLQNVIAERDLRAAELGRPQGEFCRPEIMQNGFSDLPSEDSHENKGVRANMPVAGQAGRLPCPEVRR